MPPLSIAGDSVDVWPNPRFITFNSHMPSRFATFSLRQTRTGSPATHTHGEPSFSTMRLIPGGLSRWNIPTARWEYIARKFSGDGWNQLVIHTDSTLTARRVFGFFEGEGKSGTDLVLDSIEMVRKRLNPENTRGATLCARYVSSTMKKAPIRYLARTVEYAGEKRALSVATIYCKEDGEWECRHCAF